MSWLGPRSIDGGLDEVPLPTASGRLWLCGKRVTGPGPEIALARAEGGSVIVCLNERHELERDYPEYVSWLEHEAGKRALWFPVPDLHAPELREASQIVDAVIGRLERNEGVVMHCAGGIGRAPTMAICVLIRLGMSATEASDLVATVRPTAGPEAGAQRDLVATFR